MPSTLVANGSVYDDFRSVALSTALSGRTSDSGHTWVQLNGTWVINSGATEGNAAGTSSTGTEGAMLGIDFGTADVDVEAFLEQNGFRNSFGVLFRYVNSGGTIGGYWAGKSGSSSYGGLTKFSYNGFTWTDTFIAAFDDIGQGNIDDGDVVRVVASGSSIVCYRNGTQVLSTTDSSYNGTTHGLFQRFSGTTSSGQFYAFNMHPVRTSGWTLGRMAMS